MLNHITIMGRLVRDPELRRTGSGIAVTSFTLAVDRDYKSNSGEKETDFIECVAWRNTGEFVGKYCEEICNDEIIDGVYYYLIDDGCDFDFSLEKMVSHFVIDYIYNNYGNKSLVTIMNYLKKTDIKDVTEFFRSNEYFGKSLIESYIKNYEADVDYEEVRENATNNGDQELIDKWNRLSADYCSLNEMLRRVIVGLYDYYVFLVKYCC